MILMNWLAKKDGNGGLAFPHELENGNVRLYGEVYGNPEFEEGEFVKTSIVVQYDGVLAKTKSGNEYILIQEAPQYLNFLKAKERECIIVKNWSVDNGKIVGTTLTGQKIEGKVATQNTRTNICTLADGTKIFVDWLSRDPMYNPQPGSYKFWVFCIENCMPDIFCEHYHLFRSKD